MTQQELLANLNKYFIKRYSEKFNELNKNLYITPVVEDTFEVPVPVLGPGGGTMVIGRKGAFKLEKPAIVKVEHKRMEAAAAIYRIAIPRYEAEIAAGKPEYFNYLFDNIIHKAIANYNVTFGGPDKIRFGTSYCTYERPGSNDENKIFADLDGGDFLELRLYGCWASDKEVQKVDISAVGEVTHE